MPISKKFADKAAKLRSKFSKPSRQTLAFLFLFLLGAGFLAQSLSSEPSNDPTAASVMITNVAQNHGGTGVILNSNEIESQILTNSHVCGVVEKGGLVSGRAGTFLVTTYKRSEAHDICLITVAGNMKAHTRVATSAPTAFYESASISGHPALLPNVITKGHFSGRRVIEVMTGLRKCTDEDLQDPAKGFLCALAGGIPEVKRYESILVTATIMPGSSGSAVYDSNGDLAGLAFAGSGNLGYAWTVPFEAVRNFLDSEQFRLPKSIPENNVDIFGQDGEKRGFDETTTYRKLKDACANPESRNKVNDVCDLMSTDMLYIK